MTEFTGDSGAGTGLGTAFLLAGMNAAVTPVTVELSQPLSDIAREEIADPRVEWVIADGATGSPPPSPGRTAKTWSSPTPGQASSRTWTRRSPWSRPAAATWPTTCSRCRAWTPDHQASVDELVARRGALPGWHSFRMD
jgi:hypothetical protein